MHQMKAQNLVGLAGSEERYSSWREQREGLGRMLGGKKRIAMQYSALNNIPYVGLVDAGTVQLVESCGVEVVSSADLVQQFEATWSNAQWQSHLAAGQVVQQAVWAAFAMIRDAVRAGQTIGEFDVQQELMRRFEANGLTTDEAPNVSVNANSGNPHYSPTRDSSLPIGADDFVLLDVWAKQNQPGAVYFDITWTGYVGEHRSAPLHAGVRSGSRGPRRAITLVQRALNATRLVYGYEVDDAAREVITRRGYSAFLVHRTGHSIGEDVHGNGGQHGQLRNAR